MFLIAVKKISKDQLESIIINLFTPSHNPPKNFKTRQEKFIQLLKIAGDAASKSVTQRTQHLATTLISALDGAATTQRSLVVTLNQSIYARTGIEELTKLESPSECERLQAVLLPAPIQAKPVHATPGTPPEEEDPDDFEEVTPAQLQPAKEPQEQRESVVDEFAARKLPRLNSSGLVELISNTVERTLPKKAPAPLSHKSSYAPQTGEYFNIERTIQEQTYIFMHPASDKATISPTNKNMGAQPLARALEDAKKLTTGKENVTVFIPVTQTPRAHWTLLKLQMSNGKVTHADWHDPKRRILWSTDNADTLAILRKTFPKISITEKYHTDKQSIRDTTQCGYYVTDIITNEINDQLRQRPSNKETVPPEPAPDDDGAGARYLPEHLPPETREAKRLPTDGAAAQQPRAVVPGDEASADALSQAGLFGQQHEEAEVAKERSAGKDNEQIVPPTEGF